MKYLPFVLNVFVDTPRNSYSSQSVIPTGYKHQTHTEGQAEQGKGPVMKRENSQYVTCREKSCLWVSDSVIDIPACAVTEISPAE